ncbi:MAG: carboxypeptidase regulatory-like domain-containing protein [Gemmatimonadaceae bacterium]|nr:carboxypeptidase regulatory-like domain-containing protein [Gemmatimonadaceae bacterium]
MHILKPAVLLCLSAVFACDAGAQESLRVKVVAANGLPLSGALVALVDQSSTSFAEGLTGEAGTRTLSASPGTYRLRVRRIGYQPFFSDPVTLPRTGEFVVRVDDRRVVLSTMVISASTRCGKVDRDGEALASVWEEISKALRSSQLTTEDLTNLAQAKVYRKEFDEFGLVTRSDSILVPIGKQKPFSAIEPESLAKDGYVRGNQLKGWEYFGVDETVLLSGSFIATHCFRLRRDKARPGQVGLAFEPEEGRRKADVHGVLWVDENASELRDIEFSFTNAGLLTRFSANGQTKFQRLPSGAWIIQEWKLRAPILTIRPGARERVVVTGYVEDGGGVVISSIPRSPRSKE